MNRLTSWISAAVRLGGGLLHPARSPSAEESRPGHIGAADVLGIAGPDRGFGETDRPPPGGVLLHTPVAHSVLPTGAYGQAEPLGLDRLTMADVFLPDPERPFDKQLQGWELVPPSDETRAALARLRDEAAEYLGIEEHELITEDRRRRAAVEPTDPTLWKALRVRACADFRADLYRNSKTGALVVSEHWLPWPVGVQRPDPDWSADLLKPSAVQNARSEDTAALVRMAAEIFPKNAIELLALSELKFEARVHEERSTYLREKFGGTYDRKVKRPERDARGEMRLLGEYWGHSHHVSVFGRGLPGSVVRTVLGHEVCHGLSHMLGTNGDPLSESPEWKEIFAATHQGPLRHLGRRVGQVEGGDGTAHHFNDYGELSPSELLVECMTLFLTPHAEITGSLATRADLLRLNERAHDFVHDVFARRIPEALAQGTWQTFPRAMREARQQVERDIADAQQSPGLARWTVAAALAVRVADGEPSEETLRIAQTALAEAGKHLRPELVASRWGSMLAHSEAELHDLVMEYRRPVPLAYVAR